MDNSLQQMNPVLQEVIDHHEIRKVMSVYCHGCDRGDEARMASVYLEQSWDDHGNYKGPGRQFASYVMKLQDSDATAYSHLLGQSQIRVNRDQAGAETYFIACARNQDAAGRPVVNFIGGRYVDTLERCEGEWKISKRICVRDWSISLDVVKDWLAGSDFVQGQMSGQDPSFAILGLIHSGLRTNA
jgi:hypothetical protein